MRRLRLYRGPRCFGGCAWHPDFEGVCTRCTSDTPYRGERATPGNGGRARWFVVGPGSHELAMPPVPLTMKRDQAEQLAFCFNYAFRLGLGAGLIQAFEPPKGKVR